jgi:hypothetical protein
MRVQGGASLGCCCACDDCCAPNTVRPCSIEDASKALSACQGATLDTQPEHPLRLTYAQDRFPGADAYHQQQQGGFGGYGGYGGYGGGCYGGGGAAGAGLPPQAAAEAALAYAGWAPKEFGEGAAAGAAAGEAEEDVDPLAAWEEQQRREAEPEGQQQGQQGQASGQGGQPQQQGQPAQQQQPVQQQATEEYDPLAPVAEQQPQQARRAQQTAQQHAAALQAQRAAAQAAGFRFDPASGYMLEPVSGYYFDANTGGYCGLYCSLALCMLSGAMRVCMACRCSA